MEAKRIGITKTYLFRGINTKLFKGRFLFFFPLSVNKSKNENHFIKQVLAGR
jgi:hypothetical protein